MNDNILCNDLPPVLTPEDVQHYLHIGRTKAYQLVRSGALPAVRVGRQYRIPRAYFVEYLESHTTNQ